MFLFKLNQSKKNNNSKLLRKSKSFANYLNNPTRDYKIKKPITIHHYINKDYILLENIINNLKKKNNRNLIIYLNKTPLKINKYNKKINLVLGPKKTKEIKNFNEIVVNTRKNNNKNKFKRELSAKLNIRNTTDEIIKKKNKINDMIYKNRFTNMKKELKEEKIKINFVSHFVKYPSLLGIGKSLNNNFKFTTGSKFVLRPVQSANSI